jgi:hypothetical protein
MALQLYYGHHTETPIDVTDEDQLARELDRIDQESRSAGEPWMVALLDTQGRELALGVGADASVMTWTDESDEQSPYLISHGMSPTGGSDDELAYYYGAWSEFAPTAAVPPEVARQAARDFLLTGERPGDVDWQG